MVWGFALICLVIASLVSMVSNQAVPPLFWGIKYNQFSKGADTGMIYAPGRYFIGPFSNFILFPSTVQTIEFSNEPRIPISGKRYEALHTRTKEGLGLHLQVSLQYRLRQKTLGKLYNEFNQNYEQVFISSVRDMLIKSASEYEATHLWQQREAFGAKMQELVNNELQDTYAECWGLQLWVIDLPDKFEHSIVQTQVQKQMMLIREQEQKFTKIRAETTVIEAEYDRAVKVLLAQGHANYTITTKSAHAYAQKHVLDAHSEIAVSLKQTLGFDGSSLVKFQKYDAVGDLGGSNIYHGFGGNQFIFKKDGP
jgi:regulator of protease activity HflC (stomatin/prohibitin superfamily)